MAGKVHPCAQLWSIHRFIVAPLVQFRARRRVCVCMCTRVLWCMYMGVGRHMEVRGGHWVFRCHLSYFLKQGLSLSLEVSSSARPAGQWGLRIRLSPPPQGWGTDANCHSQLFLSAGHLDSGLHTCMISVLLTEDFPGSGPAFFLFSATSSSLRELPVLLTSSLLPLCLHLVGLCKVHSPIKVKSRGHLSMRPPSSLALPWTMRPVCAHLSQFRQHHWTSVNTCPYPACSFFSLPLADLR